MSGRNDTIKACLGIIDRNAPPAKAVGLSAAEKSRLIANGTIRLRAAPLLRPLVLVKRASAPRAQGASNYGRCLDVAREYLSIPRIHGEMKMLARLRGISPTGLSSAVNSLRGTTRRDAA